MAIRVVSAQTHARTGVTGNRLQPETATPQQGGFRMYRTPLTHMHPKQNPTGNTLVRLADITLEARLEAIHHMMKYQQLTDEEAVVMLDLCIDPGDTSCRIAA